MLKVEKAKQWDKEGTGFLQILDIIKYYNWEGTGFAKPDIGEKLK